MAVIKIRNTRDLEEVLKVVAKNAMTKEVAEEAEETMKKKIDTEVYQTYTPVYYERTYQLRDESVEIDMIDDLTLELKNTRTDGSKYIPSIIEYGKGYTWGYKRNLDEEIGPRPFGAKTHEELKNGGFKKALVKGLKNQGVKVV